MRLQGFSIPVALSGFFRRIDSTIAPLPTRRLCAIRLIGMRGSGGAAMRPYPL
jgi:hypothetical protein